MSSKRFLYTRNDVKYKFYYLFFLNKIFTFQSKNKIKLSKQLVFFVIQKSKDDIMSVKLRELLIILYHKVIHLLHVYNKRRFEYIKRLKRLWVEYRWYTRWKKKQLVAFKRQSDDLQSFTTTTTNIITKNSIHTLIKYYPHFNVTSSCDTSLTFHFVDVMIIFFTIQVFLFKNLFNFQFLSHYNKDSLWIK